MKKAVLSLLPGHPDKVCDQLADAIVDEYVRRDPRARVHIRVLGAHGMVMVGGEVFSSADFDLSALVRQVYREIGYEDEIEVFVNLHSASSLIPAPCTVQGYATRETRERLPLALVYARSLARRLEDLRRTDPAFHWLRPDGQVQILLDRKHVETVTVLASHASDIDPRDVQTALFERVVTPIVGGDGIRVSINPLGACVPSGLAVGTGVSGNRMSSDTYGGLIPYGDGVLSGKDPLHAERSGAYLARLAARMLVDQGYASSAVVSATYVPGRTEPIAVYAQGTPDPSGIKTDLTSEVMRRFDFRPEAIVERLGLLRPLYRESAVYGPFGRVGFPWEEEHVA